MEPRRRVFVFGSNLAGVHGAGAARDAMRHHGAVFGVGVGLQGNSYAIPTKDETLTTLPLARIQAYVDVFINFARENTHITFDVTRIGCGYAGYTDNDIAPMFKNAPDNVVLPKSWGGKGFDW